MGPKCSRRRVLKGTGISVALMGLPGATAHLAAAEITTRYDYKPKALNAPIGTAPRSLSGPRGVGTRSIRRSVGRTS